MAAKTVLMSALAGMAYGQTLPLPVMGSNDPATARRWVEITNRYRCMHGVGPVGWSAAVSSQAQTYVDTMGPQLITSTSLCLQPPFGPAGENLASGYSKLEDAVTSWYNEHSNCIDGNGCVPPGVNGLETRHYTAVVWKGVTQIGCAINQNTSVYICRYRSGDTLGPQTANMPQFFKDSVFPESKSLSDCTASASGALDPVLPDPSSLYPNIPIIGTGMSSAACPGVPGQHASNRNIRHAVQIFALAMLVVVCLCCAGGCYYARKFIKPKDPTGGVYGMMAEHHSSSHKKQKHKSGNHSEMRSQLYSVNPEENDDKAPAGFDNMQQA